MDRQLELITQRDLLRGQAEECRDRNARLLDDLYVLRARLVGVGMMQGSEPVALVDGLRLALTQADVSLEQLWGALGDVERSLPVEGD